ncbi:MAG: alpha/beta hydrolase [Rhodoglobus sp.]
MNRRFTALALTLSLGLILSGCVFLRPNPEQRSGPAPTDREGFYRQSLSWRGCGGGLACATVKAPIDWDSPADGAIDLAVVKHSAIGAARGSLLLNPGGPGGSGWDYVHGSGEFSATPAVIENFDLVGWDPRGVGRSSRVTCFTDPQDTDDTLYGTYDNAYNTQGWIEELTAEEVSFAAACEKNTGALLGNIDAASNARDMDMLRAVLGDDKLNYLGYSYGTYLGAVYAELFPNKVGRFVLDGAVDPLVNGFESLTSQMVGFDSAFRAYLRSCLDGEGCPFTGTVDEAALQARAVLDGVDALALVNDDGRVLDSPTVATGIIGNLYSESSWDSLTEMFVQLAAGDPSLSFESADSYNSRNSDGSYRSNSYEVYVSANCVDGEFADDPASTLDRIAEIDAAAPILGKHAAFDDFAVLDVACSNWPFPRGDLPSSFEAQGAGPILVIGTTNDPATPYASAVSLAQQLSSGVLISYQGEGHTIYNQGVDCVDDAVDAYFVKGTVPQTDPMC